MKKLIVSFVLLLAAGLASWVIFAARAPSPQMVTLSEQVQELIDAPAQPAPSGNEPAPAVLPKPDPKPDPDPDPTPSPVSIPGKKELTVPFIVQAPFANWEAPYDEACEEASVLIVDHFYKGTSALSEEQMKDEIDALVDWGLREFNGVVDTSAQETARYFTDYLGYDEKRVFVLYDFSINDLKALVAEGYPVIVPVAGQDIGNKYFRQPGPLYHMLVITGYDQDTFITNDPGTKRGEDYVYDQQVLYAAIHDLTPVLENIREGRKALIIVKP